MSRQTLILEKAQSTGRVSVDDLARAFGVSTHTVRRDINALCEQGKLRRLHGGAEFIEAGSNLPYSTRTSLNIFAKQKIAAKVARLIPDGATLFFSIGTTPAIVAAALADREGLTVITSNLNVAVALSEAPKARIILPGGELRLPDRDILGPGAQTLFEKYRADFAIYGVGGVDADGSLLDFEASEVRMRETLHANARRRILVADATKFGRNAAAVGGHLQDPDLVVIDALPQPCFQPLLDGLDGRLLVAEDAP